MQNAIAYYRVSTKRQGRSGLSLAAQQRAVNSFVQEHSYKLTGEYREVRSSRDARQALIAALKHCKETNAILVIAKLDRLSRSVAFISTLMESGVAFKVVDNPFAERFTLHILAAVAEKELKDIRDRTRAALAAAKRRGTELGKYGRNVLSKINIKRANQFARKMKPVLHMLRAKGIVSLRAISAELNRLKVPTFRKRHNKWHTTTVFNLLKRLSND
jgi:DNA invertase Pin-like site-specific DNA recombinase